MVKCREYSHVLHLLLKAETRVTRTPNLFFLVFLAAACRKKLEKELEPRTTTEVTTCLDNYFHQESSAFSQ